MTAEAKVILTAQDRTAAAFRSAKANLDQFNRGLGGVQNLLGKFGVGFSVAAITTGLVRAAKSAIEYGDNLQKAAARTGIAASDFGVLADAAKMADIDMTSLSTALKKMQIAMSEAASGAKAPKEALAALGLTISDIQELNAEDQFLLLADRISQLKSPADKTRAAVELFGKAGADLLPLFEQGAEGIRKARAEIERLGGRLTDEQIQKLADADDAIKRLDQSWSNFARTLTSNVAPTLTRILNQMAGGQPDLVFETARLKELQRRREPYTQPGYDKRVLADLDRQIAETQKRIGEARVRMWAESGMRASGPSNPRGRSGSAPVVPGFAPENDSAGKPTKGSATDPFLDLRRQYENIYKEGTKALQSLETPSEAIVRNFEEQKYALEQLAATYPSFAGQAQEAIARLAVNTDDQLQALKQMPPVMQEAEQAASQMSIFAEEAARNMQSAFAEFFYSFDGGLKGMLSSFVDTIRKMVAQLLASQILTAFFNWGAGFFGTGSGIGKFFGSMSKGITGKAIGGPVMAGMPYKVGERGAEMFVPSSNGMIVPNHALAGGVSLNYTIDARGADAERIMAIMPGLLKRTKDEAVSEIRSLVARGRM